GTSGRTGRDAAPDFVFPGQGGQWPMMAKGLLRSSRVFAEAVAECEAALDPYTDWSLGAVLRGDPRAPEVTGPNARVDVVRPVLCAGLVSIVNLLSAVRVEPAAVVGRSQGELAAACAARASSLEDGARIIALRSRLFWDVAGHGGMAAVRVGPERLT